MMNESIGFVILHYQQLNETVSCVNSIIDHVDNPNIIIVDNHSPNDTGKELQEKYKNKDGIRVILLDNNYGFAYANNIGYLEAKKAGMSFICCINNDTEIIQDDFCELLKKEYMNSHFAVLGPMVRVRDNSIQGFSAHMKSVEEYVHELKLYENSETYASYLKKLDFLTKSYLKYPRLMGFVRKLKQKIHCPYNKRMEKILLHGCFLVFSNEYISRFDTAFHEGTFMYREEELLFLRLSENNLLSVYANDIVIKHLEKASTKSKYKNLEERYQFVRRCQIDSLKLLIDRMNELGGNLETKK